ncbi:bro-a [Mamestra brassicae multiple nucleopolyhedrovirus]|uniref:Bro-a n=1 Tax=Mamestra brassicae nuclear polyhedrosis virus TaxID=78219 RepID=I3XM37_NPVMB|nr:bro-a [Mamestra brassicae multiple nucleopolyhedrovirus]AFL64870.1 bro-a [Mamestra brassicae multiple nucleopolyhedrovirus]WRQ96592.1 bro-a [Mamestra configurata nucleopolyhedrovirus B]WRQ96753.1 bro-a [Mamestra configurata nucleopolyhedrovirus B]WRQ96916.1 bro-a [Mamestra configurata nucleopolyhedrovirus B]
MSLIKFEFANTNFEVISLTDDNGELWMLANPFARILEYYNPNKAVRIHVSDRNQCCLETIHPVQLGPITSSLGSRQIDADDSSLHPKTKFINRAGLFELIQSSRMPKAQEFKNWINSNLLPKLCEDINYNMATDAPMEIVEGINAATTKFYYCNEVLNVVTIVDEHGEPWMIANPFAKILEYSNAPNAIAKYVSNKNQLCYENIRSPRLEEITSSLHPKTKFINRAGLFELIQSSRMPKAQEFKNWINSDLLPKLCNDGDYNMVKDAPIDITQSMNVIHSVTNDGKEALWLKDLSELKQIVALKDQIIVMKDEENKKLTVNLQEANQNLIVANQGLLQAFNIVNEARKDSENARKETAQLANRMADIAQDVIAKPANPQLLHSLAVCSMGGDQYAFVRPQKRSLKRSLDRLAVEERDIVFKSDYVPNGVNVLNKVKEALPKDTFTARHNKITLLNDMTKEELVDVISSTMTTRQLALAKKSFERFDKK